MSGVLSYGGLDRRMTALLGLFGMASAAVGQHPGHTMHPLMQGQQFVLQVHLVGAETKIIEVPLKMVTTEAPQTLDQAIELPAPRKPLAARRYLPKAAMEQEVVADESGTNPPALELSLEGSTQSFRRWLAAGDPERNRLSSYIGTWRFMAVQSKDERDTLWRQFETEFTRAPEIVVRGAGESGEQRIPVVVGRTKVLDELGGKFTVKKFYPDCAMNQTTGEATNQSERRRNPAALVEIEHAGAIEARWVFAKFPGFAPAQGHALPYQVTLDCAIEPAEGLPDFAIVAIGEKAELWTRSGRETNSKPIAVGEKVPVPGTSYQFNVGKIVSSAQMKEIYKKDEKGKAALEIEYIGSGGTVDKLWIELGHTRSVTTVDGQIMVSLQVRDENAKGSSNRGGHP